MSSLSAPVESSNCLLLQKAINYSNALNATENKTCQISKLILNKICQNYGNARLVHLYTQNRYIDKLVWLKFKHLNLTRKKNNRESIFPAYFLLE